MRKLRRAGIAAAAVAVCAVMLSGPAQAQPDNGGTATPSQFPTTPPPSPSPSNVKPTYKTPVAHNCGISTEIVKKGQRNLKGRPSDPRPLSPDQGKLNYAKPVSKLQFVAGPQGSSTAAAVAMTSWYDTKGRFQLRAMILPVKAERLDRSLHVVVLDGKRHYQEPTVNDAQNRLSSRTWKVNFRGRAVCVSATVDTVATQPMLFLAWDGDFNARTRFDVPLPSTTIHTTVRNSRWEGEELTVRRPNELARLVADGMNGKVKIGYPNS